MSTSTLGFEKTMLAAVVERFKQPYVLKKIPLPQPPLGHDILIKVHAASFCHTDAVFAAGGLSQDLPRIGCHEFAGEIVAVGSGVTRSGITIGSRVGVPGRAYHPCGSCYECTLPSQDEPGYSPYCPKAGNLGLTRDGGFQEYCLADSRQVVPLPDAIQATQAAPLMCAGLTIWSALEHARVRTANRVAILGAGGGLGHIGVQFAANMGKEVLAVDANDQALSLLEEMKADLGTTGQNITVADARKSDATQIKQQAFAQLLKGSPATEVGYDAVILLPDSQRAFDMGMELLRNRGTMVVVSFPKDKLAVSAHDLVFRHIEVVGSLVGRNHQLEEMLDFVTTHNVAVQTKIFPFRDLNHLVELSHKGEPGKLVVDMTLG